MQNRATFEWFQKAQQEKFAIGAFNVDDFDIFKAVAEAGEEMKSPVMVEFSKGEIEYLGIENCVDIANNLEDEHKIPIILNLDHSEDLNKIKQAVDAGFHYVHFDGGKIPYQTYLPAVREAAKYAHDHGRVIEGEIDHITGGSALQDIELKLELSKGEFTNPAKAKQFVDDSGVDTFAAFIGNSHGLYASLKRLDLRRLQDIKDMVGDKFLSLHGSSGTDENDLKAAIQIGIVKINLNTEIRKAHRDGLEQGLKEDPKQVNVSKYNKHAIEAVKNLVKEKIQLFGSVNKIN